MCRSIKTLRPPYTEDVTPEEVQAAALQYVRKVAGMRKPSKANTEAFDEAVARITEATEALLADIEVRPAPVPDDGKTGHKAAVAASTDRMLRSHADAIERLADA